MREVVSGESATSDKQLLPARDTTPCLLFTDCPLHDVQPNDIQTILPDRRKIFLPNKASAVRAKEVESTTRAAGASRNSNNEKSPLTLSTPQCRIFRSPTETIRRVGPMLNHGERSCQAQNRPLEQPGGRLPIGPALAPDNSNFTIGIVTFWYLDLTAAYTQV